MLVLFCLLALLCFDCTLENNSFKKEWDLQSVIYILLYSHIHINEGGMPF